MNVDGNRDTGTWQAAPDKSSGERQPSPADTSGVRQPADSEVHVWQASLDLPPERVRKLERFLSSDELDRARRFLVRSARDRYTVARAVLRNILTRYVAVAPADLRFRYTEYGKPELAHPATSIEFNLSHSYGLAVYAVTAGVPVGIDVEYLHRRATMDRLRIAHRLFSDREYNELASTPPYRRDQAFLACWTRKEAFIKAIGQGLSCPLDQFDVTVDPGVSPELRATHWDPLETGRWSMASVDPGPDYIGALAVPVRNLKITRWQWSHDQSD